MRSSIKTRFRQTVVFSLLGLVGFIFYRTAIPPCESCKSKIMVIESDCIPVPDAYTVVYKRLSCFCDRPQDWQQLSTLLRHTSYYKNAYGQRYPISLFGTKRIPCSYEENYEVFDDKNVFLYVKQDTSKAVYDGALKELYFSSFVYSKDRKIGVFNVGKADRQITRKLNGLVVRYLMDYDRLNRDALISFQQAIDHDSTYRKQFKEVDYHLIRRGDTKPQASVRYQDYGVRFYFDVL